MSDLPRDASVVVGDGAVGDGDVFAVVAVGVVKAAVALPPFRGVGKPGFGEGDALFRSLVLQSEMLEEGDDVFEVCCCEGLGGGVAGHEGVVNRHGDCAAGFVEEDDRNEKAEGVVLEGFLGETKCGGG